MGLTLTEGLTCCVSHRLNATRGYGFFPLCFFSYLLLWRLIVCDYVHASLCVTGNVKFLLVFLFVVAKTGGHSFQIPSLDEVWEWRMRVRQSSE